MMEVKCVRELLFRPFSLGERHRLRAASGQFCSFTFTELPCLFFCIWEVQIWPCNLLSAHTRRSSDPFVRDIHYKRTQQCAVRPC